MTRWILGTLVVLAVLAAFGAGIQAGVSLCVSEIEEAIEEEINGTEVPFFPEVRR